MPENYRHKIICDPVHADIGLSAVEHQLIDCPSFQRLRHLKQLGLASLVYPNASHSRFAHSLGVFRIMGRVIDLLVAKGQLEDDDRRKMRVAALLHDIGHYPYSHLMEFIDRDKYRADYLGEAAPSEDSEQRPRRPYPGHEEVGQTVITKRKDIVATLKHAGLVPKEIAAIIGSEHGKQAYNRLIHSSLDMDRMDYLMRDSLGMGVPYGRIDMDYLLSNLDVDDEGDVVVAHKAAAAAEHFLVARYFMYKTVYMHKTTFAFEAMLRHIVFLARQRGHVYRDGDEIEEMIVGEPFLEFHDGYIDRHVHEVAGRGGNEPLVLLCRALKERKPPKLLHEVAVLHEKALGPHRDVALFCHDRIDRIKSLVKKHKIDKERWIWEDPKDVSFESMGPFVPLSQVSDVKPEETAALIRVRYPDGKCARLVDDPHSIIHHLSRLKLQMSRLYVVGPVSDDKLARIKKEIQSWLKPE